jgi:hypothetical protein
LYTFWNNSDKLNVESSTSGIPFTTVYYAVSVQLCLN